MGRAFGLQFPGWLTVSGAAVFLLLSAGLGALYLWSPKATLHIATGPSGGVADRFVTALIKATEATHPHVHFVPQPVADLAASAKALEDGKVDIALVRSDVAPPVNGQSLVILRRDALAIVLPGGSKLDSVTQLQGKTVLLPEGPTQKENEHAFDLILSFFDVSPQSVKRLFLPMAEIGAAVREKRAVAVLAVGPIGPGQAVDVVAAVAKATRRAPTILPLDEGDSISKRFPGFESIDIPQGVFRAHPATPEEDIKGVAVSYRLVVPTQMLDAVAGLLARSILKTKARLMQLTPTANQIEAPDPNESNPVLPPHPGVANYLASGDQSFFDEIQGYIYIVGVPLSLLGSVVAIISGLLANRRLIEDQRQIFRLLMIAEEASEARAVDLAALEKEFKGIVAKCVGEIAEGTSGADQAAVSLAIEHARRAIEERKAALGLRPDDARAAAVADESAGAEG
jgi:TRAP-type uncharacterized transport system substrate-binding protein